jgi:hypothetical protein
MIQLSYRLSIVILLTGLYDYTPCQLNGQTDRHSLHLREATLEPTPEETKSSMSSYEVTYKTNRCFFLRQQAGTRGGGYRRWWSSGKGRDVEVEQRREMLVGVPLPSITEN